MIALPITKQAKQLTIAINNEFPLHNIHNLRNKIISKAQHIFSTQIHKKKNGSHSHITVYLYTK